MLNNNLKKKMDNGEVVYGLFINTGSTVSCEIAGLCGFDFVLIDSEHGPTDVLSNRELIIASENRNCPPLVRISNSSSDLILRTLDIGAHGIMVPQVNTVEKAMEISAAARYSPQGSRGVASTRASDYGFIQPFTKYAEMANNRNLIIAQCENVSCLPNLDGICAIDGIDVIFIGPYDLSSSMGQLGKVDYPYIEDTVNEVLKATRKHGKHAGIFTKNPEEAKFYASMGFQFIAVGTDISCMISSYRNVISELR